MRAYSWLLLGSAVIACGGGAFTATDEGNGGSGNSAGASGRGFGGTMVGGGGKVGSAGSSSGGTGNSAGFIGISGDVGIAGDLIAGGSVSAAGEPGVAGMGPDPEPIDETCPAAPPAEKARCKNGLLCSYGGDIRTDCRNLAKCDGGIWTVEAPTCPAIHGCGDIVVGKACGAQALPCIKDGSLYCECWACEGPLCNGSDPPTWKCAGVAGEASCPKLAPNEGQACMSKLDCTYGACGMGLATDVTCDGTTWAWQGLTCPL